MTGRRQRSRPTTGRTALVGGGACLALVLAVAAATGAASDEEPVRHDVGEVVFADEFDGAALDADSWNTCHWWDDGGCTIATNRELQWYLPDQVEVRDGALRLTADPVPIAGGGTEFPYRSGMVTTGPPTYEGTANKFAFTYGHVEARVRVPAGQGLWAALWMLPADREARPEIDLLEVLGDRPQEVLTHLHPADPARRPEGSTTTVPAGFLEWREVRLDWTPGELRWWVDDQLVWTRSGPDVPAEPMYLVANLAVGGTLGGDVGRDTRFPATFEIDYIRVSAP